MKPAKQMTRTEKSSSVCTDVTRHKFEMQIGYLNRHALLMSDNASHCQVHRLGNIFKTEWQEPSHQFSHNGRQHCINKQTLRVSTWDDTSLQHCLCCF